MKRNLAAAILAVLGVVASAAAAKSGGQVVIAYLDQPDSLNPAKANYGISSMVSWAFTNSLFTTDQHNGDVPDLVERWSVSRDGLTWTFHLRPGVRFSDGTGMTSRDVLASLRTIMNPDAVLSNGALSGVVRELTADGPDTFTVRLSSPYSLLPSLLQRPIVPWRALEGTAAQKAEYERRPVGTGPFRLAEWTPDLIALDANPLYVGGRPPLDRIDSSFLNCPCPPRTEQRSGQAC